MRTALPLAALCCLLAVASAVTNDEDKDTVLNGSGPFGALRTATMPWLAVTSLSPLLPFHPKQCSNCVLLTTVLDPSPPPLPRVVSFWGA